MPPKRGGRGRRPRDPRGTARTRVPTGPNLGINTFKGSSLTAISEAAMPLFNTFEKRRLRYSTNISITSSTGVPAFKIFSVNGLFDPDISGTGHQPAGFDQMMVFFNHYCGLSARIKVLCKNTNANTLTVGIRQDADTSPLTVIDQIIEDGGVVYDNLEAKGVYGANKTLQMSCSILKLQGLSLSNFCADSTLRGSAAANPTEQSYFHLGVWDSSGTGGTVNMDVVIDFVAMFLEPRDATESLQVQEQRAMAKLFKEITGVPIEEKKELSPAPPPSPAEDFTVVRAEELEDVTFTTAQMAKLLSKFRSIDSYRQPGGRTGFKPPKI